jgi:hypothetical protein
MNFGKFNKQRLFTVDTSSFDYLSIEEAAKKYGTDVPIRIRGLYIGDKSKFVEEDPRLATDEEYINLPQHQLKEVKQILADPGAIRAINNGQCGFIIREYFQKRFQMTCYSAEWCNYEEPDEEEEE